MMKNPVEMQVKKIDFHVHVTPEKDLLRITGGTYPTPDELRGMYDILGIEKGLLLPPGSAPEFTADRVSQREARKMVERNPETLGWWFCNIDPRAGTNSEHTDFSHYLKYYKSKGAKGVGEITANLYLDDPRLLNLFAHCEKCEMPVLMHFGNMGHDYGVVDELHLPRLEKILKMFGSLKIIGHSPKFWAEISGDVTEETRQGNPAGKVVAGGRVVELMRRYPNLHCEISSVSGHNAISRDPEFTYCFFEEFSDRVLYGSDIHDPRNIDKRVYFDAVDFLDNAVENKKISQTTYEKISRKNALRILEA
jgi:predicted TIM-barrel fold metal-dependent hydrolase